MKKEKEALIWCPDCGKDLYELWRVPTGQGGVFTHQAEPESARETIEANNGRCECGGVPQRKP